MQVIRLAVRLVRDGLVVATADQLDGVWNQLEKKISQSAKPFLKIFN